MLISAADGLLQKQAEYKGNEALVMQFSPPEQNRTDTRDSQRTRAAPR